ncbi:MAG TPA: hypothetical protein VGL99_10120 [Chloroflexota bacterium]|jgi:hypothetical protein
MRSIKPLTVLAATVLLALVSAMSAQAAPPLAGATSATTAIALADGDHDKIAVQKVALENNLGEGNVASFRITLTTQPFPIDGVVLTDVLPPGGPWTVSGPDAGACTIGGTPLTLTCNYGTLGDFGVVVTKTVTISGPTSDPNCGVLSNTAHVDVAASEEETLLANNDSTASISVRCGRRMTGGGSIFTPIAGAQTRVTHGFELHCNRNDDPNRLEINWSANGVENNFHLGDLTSATCSDDPAIIPNPPGANFDTYVGTGTGTCNGLPASISFRLTDAGEPGTSDTAQYTISGSCSLSTAILPLIFGNHQAH